MHPTPTHEIQYTHNKYRHIDARYYTTMRLASDDYHQEGAIYWVWVSGCVAPDHKAKLVKKTVLLLSQLDDATCYLANHCNAAATANAFKNKYPDLNFTDTEIAVLVFENLEATQ